MNREQRKENKQGTAGRVILASASPRRKELLAQIGIAYEVVPSRAEEKTEKKLPEEIVQELSAQKASEVCARLEEQGEDGYTVIGADTVVSFQGEVMGKPKDAEDACRMLRILQGNTHQVYTGVTLCQKSQGHPARFCTFYEKTDVSMYSMSAEEIEAYVATGEPMDKAGAYAVQGRCAAYIRGVCGDYNNVVGLPVGRLYQEMKRKL
ncbi:MAG TPA: septum formation protein Maf [Lachnospiraceae bacterium]|nr:septum formation protein Maf [Lachnospiraceae bacterium]